MLRVQRIDAGVYVPACDLCAQHEVRAAAHIGSRPVLLICRRDADKIPVILAALVTAKSAPRPRLCDCCGVRALGVRLERGDKRTVDLCPRCAAKLVELVRVARARDGRARCGCTPGGPTRSMIGRLPHRSTAGARRRSP